MILLPSYNSLSACVNLIISSPSSNILSLRLRSLHSLPDAWQPGTFPHTFALALPLPTTEATPTIPEGVTIPQGTLKLGPDKDPASIAGHWKWPGSGGQVNNGAIKMHALEDETGELNTKQVSEIVCCTYVYICVHADNNQ